MKYLALIIITIVRVNISYSQDVEFRRVIQDFCTKAENINWKSKSQQEIASQIANISTLVRNENKTLIDTIKFIIKQKNPSFLDNDLELDFGKQFTIYLVDECPKYIELSKSLLPNSPETNSTLELYTEKMDEILSSAQDKSYIDQYKLADESIGILCKEIDEQAKKDYKDGTLDFLFTKDVGLYLMHHSKYYYKAFMVFTQMQQLENIYK